MARSEKLRVCVVLDGDQRNGQVNKDDIAVTYLPGDMPDATILAPVQADPGLLAARLGISADDVALALDAVRFREHQYWFTGIAQSLHIDKHVLIDHLVSVWLAHEAVQAEARALVRRIHAALLETVRQVPEAEAGSDIEHTSAVDPELR